jgi:hypothetical protein
VTLFERSPDNLNELTSKTIDTSANPIVDNKANDSKLSQTLMNSNKKQHNRAISLNDYKSNHTKTVTSYRSKFLEEFKTRNNNESANISNFESLNSS